MIKTHKIIPFLKLIRWFHEVVAILPFLALFIALSYFVDKENISCSLSVFDFIILCLGVQFLIATGCILNDIMDRDIDKINKPLTHIVNNHFTLKQVFGFFKLFSVITLLISIYISVYMFWEWAYISVVVYILSLSYNMYFKKTPLMGNILIAILSSFIPIVIIYFANDCFNALQTERMEVLVYMFAIFPFFLIIARELSLDISDFEGDAEQGCKTLPIVIGKRKAKYVVYLFVCLLYVLCVLTSWFFPFFIFPNAIIVGMLIVYHIWLTKCDTRIEYIRAGRFLWSIMIIGLLGYFLAAIFVP